MKSAQAIHTPLGPARDVHYMRVKPNTMTFIWYLLNLPDPHQPPIEKKRKYKKKQKKEDLWICADLCDS